MEKTPASIIYSYRLLLSNANLIYNPAYIISQHIYILKLTGFFKTQVAPWCSGFRLHAVYSLQTALTISAGRQSAAVFNRLHAIYQSTGRTIAFLLHAASGRVYRPHQISITGSSTQYIINHQYIITSMQSCSVLSSNFSHERHLQNAAVSRRNLYQKH